MVPVARLVFELQHLICRLVDFIINAESAVSTAWQPVVLPVGGSQHCRDVLEDFTAGKKNMLIVVAGSSCHSDVPPCSLVIRSALYLSC